MGIHHHLGGLMLSIGMRLPRKITGQKLGHCMHVFGVLCDLMNYCVMVCMPCCMHCVWFVCLEVST